MRKSLFSKIFVISFFLFLFPNVVLSFDQNNDSFYLSPFIKNLGQCDESILYYSDNEWGRLCVRNNDFVLQIKDEKEGKIKNIYLKFKKKESYEIVGVNKQETYFNYFIGLDKQIKDVPLFNEIVIKEFFLDRDLILSSKNSTFIDEQLFNDYFEIDSNCPCWYEEGKIIINLNNKPIKFDLFNGELKNNLENTESQSLIFSTYLGGTYPEGPFEIAYDSSQNIVVAGNTYSSNFPVPSGYDSTYGEYGDMFLAKLSSNGNSLLWGTFIGGYNPESIYTVKVDNDNNVVFGGLGQSTTPTPNGNSNSYSNQMYIGKLSSDGRNLLWGTKLGSGEVSKLVLDSQNFIYFVGVTSANDLQCVNGYGCSFNGGETDLYICKLNPNGNLVASTYLGGGRYDGSHNTYEYGSFIYNLGPFIDLDFNGDIVVATYTDSTSIPIVNGYQSALKGNRDLYVAKISNDCSSLIGSTFLGGSLAEIVGGLKCDAMGNIIVAGCSRSLDMPVYNPFQSSHSTSDYYDGYIAKLSGNLSQLIFGTYLGGSKEDLIRAITIDGVGNIIATGTTLSPDFPLKDPYQSSIGGYDAFLSALDKNGNSLLASTFFGGNDSDRGTSLLYDSENGIVLSGYTKSSNFPTKNAYCPALNGYVDVFISKMSLTSISSCKLNCSANVPTVAKPNEAVSFSSTITVEPIGCTDYSVLWDFGDGTTSSEENPTHKYTSEGKYYWKLTVSGNGVPSCSKSGTITITNSNCRLTCEAYVPSTGAKGIYIIFSASSTATDCSQRVSYHWDFGDGQSSNSQNPTHAYSNPGFYTWKMTASSDSITCEKEGTIEILSDRPCIDIGLVRFCADVINYDGSKYTLGGNVSANNMLFFASLVELTKTSNYSGSIYTYGNVYVPNIHGADETVVSGPATFFVDGADLTLTQMSGPLLYSLNLLNLPLEIEGSEIKLEDDGVVVTPFLNLGVEPVILCRVQMSILLVPNDDKFILSVEVINGQLTPSISVSSFSITYNPDEQEITGSASIGLPFLDIASLDASVQFKPGCLDGFSIKIGLPQGIPLGTSGLEIDSFILEVDNICTPAHFYIFLGGDIAIAEVPSEVIVLEHVGLGYQVPFTLQIDGGTLAFLGYPLASIGGTITVYPPYISAYGDTNIAGLYTTHISITLDISNFVIKGEASGSLQIPDWNCCEVCLICKATRELVRSILGTLPFTFAGMNMGVSIGQNESGEWGGYLRGKVIIADKSVAVEINFYNGDIDLLVGRNYDDLYEIWLKEEKALSPLGYEKSLNLAQDQERVVFSSAGVSTLPEIYLVTPDGTRLTKENYSSYPGVSYYESMENFVSFFEISPVSKGTWAFGMTNLNQGEGELFALCAHQEPEIEFESVSPSSKGYTINLKVNPASEDTKVSLFYTNSPDYGNGLLIAKDLTSNNGNYSVSWDTSNIPNGNYMIFAAADDGKNPEEIKYFENQITVNKDTINPPTNLSGTRSGEVASLSWTPSTSSNIVGYNILYTDAPETYGYKYKSHSVYSDRGSVSGLESDKVYRFAVVAFDKDGKFSVESNSITLANTPPPSITSMTKLSSPFRINVVGSNLQQGIKVYINGTLWNTVTWKSTGNIKIKGGSSLKALVPKGVDTTFKFVNPDGGETTLVWRY